MASGRSNGSVVASNRRARHDYDVLDTVEAGIALQGSEVKSLRTAQVQLKDSYAYVKSGEVWLKGVHIAPYGHAHGVDGHDPERERKLLLHRHEIDRLRVRIERDHLTLVPLDVRVTDRNGLPVTDMKQEEFVILENSVRQKIGHFAFQQHDPGSKVTIRKVEVMELPATK